LYYYYHREKALENITKAGAARGRNIEEINRRMFEELRGMDMDKDPEGALQTFLYYMQLRENSYMAVETGGEGRPVLERGQLPIPEGIGYAGVMLDCIEGMQSDSGRYLVLSVENQGALPELNPEDVVEMTCLVSREGIRPVKVENPPRDCMLLIHSIKHYERLAVKAIMEGSSREAVRALMLHPLINSYSLAERLVKEYGEAYEGMFRK
ncbi:MAG: glycoside hydrolase, partial [Acetatifactor sp.]|nr:glycoside hydrolase [Acetatifactor sp.]